MFDLIIFDSINSFQIMSSGRYAFLEGMVVFILFGLCCPIWDYCYFYFLLLSCLLSVVCDARVFVYSLSRQWFLLCWFLLLSSCPVHSHLFPVVIMPTRLCSVHQTLSIYSRFSFHLQSGIVLCFSPHPLLLVPSRDLSLACVRL